MIVYKLFHQYSKTELNELAHEYGLSPVDTSDEMKDLYIQLIRLDRIKKNVIKKTLVCPTWDDIHDLEHQKYNDLNNLQTWLSDFWIALDHYELSETIKEFYSYEPDRRRESIQAACSEIAFTPKHQYTLQKKQEKKETVIENPEFGWNTIKHLESMDVTELELFLRPWTDYFESHNVWNSIISILSSSIPDEDKKEQVINLCCFPLE